MKRAASCAALHATDAESGESSLLHWDEEVARRATRERRDHLKKIECALAEKGILVTQAPTWRGFEETVLELLRCGLVEEGER